MGNSQDYQEILLRLESLETLYEQVDTHVLHNFELFWTIILGILAIIGVALFFISKNAIKSGIDKETEKQQKNYANLETKLEQVQSSSRRAHPEEYELSLADGVKRAGKCCYSKNRDDLVVVTFSASPSEGEFLPRIHSFASLPAGFRPDSVISHTVSDSLSVRIYKNGTILYDATTSFKEISCASIIFYAAKE